MVNESSFGTVSRLSAATLGVFRGQEAVRRGVSRKRLGALVTSGVAERILPDTYRMTAVSRSSMQSLHAAVLWAGPRAAAAGRSAAEVCGFEGVRAARPEIVVFPPNRVRSDQVVVHRSDNRAALMVRRRRGIAVTGVEPTLVALAAALDAEAFEIACEDARRRQLTSIPSLRSYLDQFAHRSGVGDVRRVLDHLDPAHPARSTLEVKTRRLLVANGLTDFVREFPLAWNRRHYLFDFALERGRTILETNGRRWHDDATDYEHDNEKWSVPGRCGYRIVFATWDKVTQHPEQLLSELTTTLAAA